MKSHNKPINHNFIAMHVTSIVYIHLLIHWLADYHMKNVLFCRVRMVSKGHLVRKEIWYDTFLYYFPR